MAILDDGVNGGYSGKLGNSVGYKWRGKWVVRALPRPSKKKRSDKQLGNQAKLTMVQGLLSLGEEFIRLGFANAAKEQNLSPFNVAMSYNRKNAVIGEYPTVGIDFEKFMFAQGDLKLPDDLCVSIEGNNLKITWDTSKAGTTKYHDQLMFILVDDNLEEIFGEVTGNERTSGEQLFDLEGGVLSEADRSPSGQVTYHVYLAFISFDRKQVSDSVYHGSFVFNKREAAPEEPEISVNENDNSSRTSSISIFKDLKLNPLV